MTRLTDEQAIGRIVALLVRDGGVTLAGVRGVTKTTGPHVVRLMAKCEALGVAHLHSEYPWRVWRVGPAAPIPMDWMDVLREMGGDLPIAEWAERIRVPAPSIVRALRDVQAEREVA